MENLELSMPWNWAGLRRISGVTEIQLLEPGSSPPRARVFLFGACEPLSVQNCSLMGPSGASAVFPAGLQLPFLFSHCNS
jgi:hypothetical protein